MSKHTKHRAPWTNARIVEDWFKLPEVATGQRVDLTKRAWRK